MNGSKHKVRYDGKAKINVHMDSDFTGDPNIRKFTSGYIILMDINPISWYYKIQATVCNIYIRSWIIKYKLNIY